MLTWNAACYKFSFHSQVQGQTMSMTFQA